jgi:hypothetical protein
MSSQKVATCRHKWPGISQLELPNHVSKLDLPIHGGRVGSVFSSALNESA